MGMSATGILAYGYDLGEDFGFEYDDPNKPTWLDDDEDNGTEAAEEVLLAAVGFTETDWRAAGYWDRKREAQARIGVKFVVYCSYDYPMYILAAKELTAYQGEPTQVDLTVPDNADERLDWAMGVLGIEAKGERPQWFLTSVYG